MTSTLDSHSLLLHNLYKSTWHVTLGETRESLLYSSSSTDIVLVHCPLL